MIKRRFIGLICLLFSQSLVWASQTPQVAGIFYPANPSELQTQVSGFLNTAKFSSSTPDVILVPHAGYDYSGSVAGTAYRQIQGSDFSVVIVLGVAHQYPLRGAAVDSNGFFETPLGKVPIHEASVKFLLSKGLLIQENPKAFHGEHSLEAQLPFLQVALGKFSLVPILLQEPNLTEAENVGRALAELIQANRRRGEKTLLVISSDFAHYPKESDAKISDEAMLHWIQDVNPEKLFVESQARMKLGVANLLTAMCGEQAILTGLFAARNLQIKKAEILRHATSADAPQGDASRVVGYSSLAFYSSAPLAASQEFSEAQRSQLLALARQGVEHYVRGDGRESVLPQDPQFLKPRAVFVTLRKKGELRGCIGITEALFPLNEAVRHYAVAAATQDPRFDPVSPAELSQITYEISILSSFTPVTNIDEIQPGRDGVLLVRGERSGIFLPQVWKETGWDKETFLSELASQKAGLAKNAWQDPQTRLSSFTVESFEDEAAG